MYEIAVIQLSLQSCVEMFTYRCNFSLTSPFFAHVWGEGDRKPGLMDAGGVWEAGRERAGSGVPKVEGTGRNYRTKLQHFAIGKTQRQKP